MSGLRIILIRNKPHRCTSAYFDKRPLQHELIKTDHHDDRCLHAHFIRVKPPDGHTRVLKSINTFSCRHLLVTVFCLPHTAALSICMLLRYRVGLWPSEALRCVRFNSKNWQVEIYEYTRVILIEGSIKHRDEANVNENTILAWYTKMTE
jgi:hypothetical protein